LSADPTPHPRLAISESNVVDGAETCVRVGACRPSHREDPGLPSRAARPLRVASFGSP
jgi:hypothetical protein